MNDKKISVIIPFYNAAKYIGATIDNITAQTYKNLEIICVSDAPTDGSDAVAADRAAKDPRIKIIRNEKNMDVAFSRNLGAAAATGEYMHFMDADDFISMDFYEVMMGAAESFDADVATCCVFYEQKPKQSVWYKKDRAVSGAAKFSKTWVFVHGWPWRYLIRRDFWNGHGIVFPDLRPLEDLPAMIQMIHYANRIALCARAWYFYKNRENSILNAVRNPERERQGRENRARADAFVDEFARRHKIRRPNKLFLHIWSQLTKR